MKMSKKIISFAAAAVLGIQALAIPVLAEVTPVYINNSDFSDCAVGGASKNGGIYGSNIIMDGSPWLSKGSAGVHYETFRKDEERGVNYCNMYSNSEKGGAFGAGSFYMYQRDTSANYTKEYGLCEFDIRVHDGTFSMMFGDFTDATSNTDFVVGNVVFTTSTINAKSKNGDKKVADIVNDKWYKVRITVNNKLQEYNVKVTDMDGKVIGSVDSIDYVQSQATGVRTWSFSYIKNGGPYNYDITNVTIDKSSEKFEL